MGTGSAVRQGDAAGRKDRRGLRSEKRKLSHLVGVRLSPLLHARLERAAEERNESTASLARRILAAALKHEAPLPISRPRKTRRPARMTVTHHTMIGFLEELQLLSSRLGRLEQSGLCRIGGSCEQDAKLIEETRDLLSEIVRTVRETRS